MTLTINTAPPADPVRPAPAQAARTVATNDLAHQAASAPAAGPPAQDAATLSRLLTQYKFDQAHGAAANTLSGLGRQIFAAAKAAGQRVTLPHSPAAVDTATAAPTAAAAGRVNLTA